MISILLYRTLTFQMVERVQKSHRGHLKLLQHITWCQYPECSHAVPANVWLFINSMFNVRFLSYLSNENDSCLNKYFSKKCLGWKDSRRSGLVQLTIVFHIYFNVTTEISWYWSSCWSLEITQILEFWVKLQHELNYLITFFLRTLYANNLP